MNILVTGGAGYIGSHACKTLSERGFLPVTYDNLSRGYREAVKWGPLEIGDTADAVRVGEVLVRYRPAAVMHFAGFTYVGESNEKPLLYYRNNIVGSAGLLQALLDFMPLPVVFSSTAAIYGFPECIPIAEDHPLRPISPYGFSKLVVERILIDLGISHKLPWMALRYFNAAGCDPDGEIGERHVPETHLIPLVLEAARSGTSVQVFGADYDTFDGTCVRDYVHVMDIADAHVRALGHLLRGGESCAVNLANSRGHSIREVIAAAEQICGVPISSVVAPRRPGDVSTLVGSADKARNVLNWQPARSDLAVQISDAWNWLRSCH